MMPSQTIGKKENISYETTKRTFSKEIKSSKNVLFINHELVQFCACWNMVIYHQQIQLLFSVLLAYSA